MIEVPKSAKKSLASLLFYDQNVFHFLSSLTFKYNTVQGKQVSTVRIIILLINCLIQFSILSFL